ncbi:MAG: hypothetical protein A4E53_01203 [Pelotomaculum sp. PtaB.Bin104]|nr:MAG: hypothetical protein A4E53_01203 [Pelotomaculum sp. PtaB.Bin104]
MLEQLTANQSKKIILELTNGTTISGTVSSVDDEFVRFETDDGVGIISLNNIQIIWEPIKRSLTEENMEALVQKLRDKIKTEIACTGAQFNCSQQYICRPPDTCTGAFACPGSYFPSSGGSQCPVAFACTGTQFYGFVGSQGSDPQAEIACTGFPAFTCSQQYICRPPDLCTFTFACPGRYVPGAPSAGGGCPIFFCGPFQFGQPCRPFTFGCGPFQFGQPCGPFTFGCGPFQFGLPCGPFQFGGSQCPTPGGFACPGQQFIGIAPGGVPK